MSAIKANNPVINAKPTSLNIIKMHITINAKKANAVNIIVTSFLYITNFITSNIIRILTPTATATIAISVNSSDVMSSFFNVFTTKSFKCLILSFLSKIFKIIVSLNKKKSP